MRERINQLAERFLQRCSQDMVSIRELMTRLNTDDRSALKELEHLAHRMCGTGASLGFESLSERAASVERLSEEQVQGSTMDSEALKRLSTYVMQLESEIAALIRTRGS